MKDRLRVTASGKASKIKNLAKGVFGLIIIMIPLLIANVVQLASAIIVLFSPKAFSSFNRACANWWWGLCVSMSDRMNRTEIIFLGDSVPTKENAMLISNHLDMTDVPVIFYLAKQKQRLGEIKWFVKDPLKYVPGIGWGMYMLGCLFVKRDWAKDASSIQRVFQRVKRLRMPIWLVNFPEGTRYTQTKQEKSRKYAVEQGVNPMENVLFPRTKGFTASILALRDHLDAIYDVTIIYPQGVPSLWQFMQGLVNKVYVDVRRFSIQSLPLNEKDLSQWLVQRFYVKDQLLSNFKEGGMDV